MEIAALRQAVGWSQQKFASHFGIPVGTLRNWEQGIAKPPEYVFTMIFQSIRRDKMINVETMKFMKMLDKLAEQSKNGIEEFSNATEETIDQKIFYSENCDFKVVEDCCIVDDKDCYHHDIISFYESYEYLMNVNFDEYDNKPYVNIKLLGSDEEIVIEDGEWYFA